MTFQHFILGLVGMAMCGISTMLFVIGIKLMLMVLGEFK